MQLTTSEATVTSPAFVRPFLLLFTLSLLFWTGLQGIYAILPLHMQALGYSESLSGWLIGLASLAAFGAQLILGNTVDRHGARPALVAGGLLLLLSALAGHVALGVLGQLLLNLLLGCALTLILIAGMAAASAIAPTAKRGSVLAWYGMANSLAGLIAAPLLTPIFTARGFTAVQFVAGLCGLAAGVLGALVRVRPEAPAQSDAPKERVLLRSALRPALVGVVLAIGASGFGLVGPLRAQVLGLANPGFYLTVQFGAVLLSRLVFGPLSDRMGRRWAIIPGLICAAMGFGLMGLTLPPFVALVAPVLFGIGFGAAGVGLMAWTVERAGADARGRAINTYYLFWEPALFVGTAGVGFLVSLLAEWAFAVVAVIILCGLLVYGLPDSVKRRS